MIIITKTTAAARLVSLEQIAEVAMAISAQKRLRFIHNWWCHNCCSTSSSLTMSSLSLFSTIIPNINSSYHSITNQTKHNNNLSKRMDNRLQFIAIAFIWMVLFVYCPIFVSAASKNSIRSIANNDGHDPYRLHSNWFDFQRQSLNHRSQQPSKSQSQEVGNIFTQLGLFIQSRQRNATEIAGNIFFKYYNT